MPRSSKPLKRIRKYFRSVWDNTNNNTWSKLNSYEPLSFKDLFFGLVFKCYGNKKYKMIEDKTSFHLYSKYSYFYEAPIQSRMKHISKGKFFSLLRHLQFLIGLVAIFLEALGGLWVVSGGNKGRENLLVKIYIQIAQEPKYTIQGGDLPLLFKISLLISRSLRFFGNLLYDAINKIISIAAHFTTDVIPTFIEKHRKASLAIAALWILIGIGIGLSLGFGVFALPLVPVLTSLILLKLAALVPTTVVSTSVISAILTSFAGGLCTYFITGLGQKINEFFTITIKSKAASQEGLITYSSDDTAPTKEVGILDWALAKIKSLGASTKKLEDYIPQGYAQTGDDNFLLPPGVTVSSATLIDQRAINDQARSLNPSPSAPTGYPDPSAPPAFYHQQV